MEQSKYSRRYDDAFVGEAVRLVVAEGLSVNRVAKQLDVSKTTLRRWIDDYRELSGQAPVIPSSEEIRRLKKELELIKTERDILKKAVGIFSQLPK